MSMNLKPGDERRPETQPAGEGYVVVSERLSRGAMAMGYQAQKGGRTFFLKQYISPKPIVVWFDGYVEYQRELKRRIESNSALKNACYEFVDFFVAPAPPRYSPTSRLYYQVFEWVTGGKNLGEIIGEFRDNPAVHPWERRLIWAKVIIGSIMRLHEQKIAHIDLKPENLILIPRAETTAGYQLKLIDMDFSLLTDLPAPWHGVAGYVGTPNWWSPEHIIGQVPGTHSDVFTCGLILYDLLGEGNPYIGLDEATYKARVLEHAARPPVLHGSMPGRNEHEVITLLHRCLSPVASARPTAAELHAALNARPTVRPPTPPPEPRMSPEPTGGGTTSHAERVPTAVRSLTLTHGGTRQVVNVTTDINKAGLEHFGKDARFWDSISQFKLERRVDGWYIAPNLTAVNETLLNGKSVAGERKLNAGDVLAVGREAKGIQKLPLTVTLETP